MSPAVLGPVRRRLSGGGAAGAVRSRPPARSGVLEGSRAGRLTAEPRNDLVEPVELRHALRSGTSCSAATWRPSV